MWFALATLAVADPAIPEGFALRPTFDTPNGSVTAGTAWATKVGDQTVIVTAYHLFGPGGGMPQQVAPADLPTYVKGLKLKDAWSGAAIAESGQALVVADARVMDAEGADADVAVFRAITDAKDVRKRLEERPRVAPAVLADAPPKVGDTVWVATSLVSGDAPRGIPVKVVEVSEHFVFWEYASTVDLTATSGAPVVDAQGRVVAMNLGGGPIDGVLVGSGAPITGVRARIEKAVAAGAKP